MGRNYYLFVLYYVRKSESYSHKCVSLKLKNLNTHTHTHTHTMALVRRHRDLFQLVQLFAE